VSPLSAESVAEVTRELEWAFGSVAIPSGARTWRKIDAFAGPVVTVAVGSIDPGNRGTDIDGGSKYGRALLPAIAISNLLAIFLQGHRPEGRHRPRHDPRRLPVERRHHGRQQGVDAVARRLSVSGNLLEWGQPADGLPLNTEKSRAYFLQQKPCYCLKNGFIVNMKKIRCRGNRLPRLRLVAWIARLTLLKKTTKTRINRSIV
jgi:hypothetical protein